MEQDKKQEKLKNYLQTMSPIMESLVKDLVEQKPDDPTEIVQFIKSWCIDNESQFLNQLLKKKEKFSEENKDQCENSLSDADDVENEEDICDILTVEEIQKKKAKQKYSVSAEAYGQFNQKGVFIPKVIPKSEEQQQTIRERLSHAFMFSALDERELKIVVDAFEEKQFPAGEKVIQQGDDGDVLYLVSEGTLDCTKVFNQSEGEKFLKTYVPGDAFGELALLYNAPRAATITAKTNSILFALDRETFNNIVKDAAQRKREGFEKTLSKIEILQDMDEYERNQIADALQRKSFNQGEYIVRQGENGDIFYFLEEGTAVATKKSPNSEQEEQVYEYSCGDYFGELALLRQQPRAANILAKTNVVVCMLDRDSFKRLLGPLEDLLKRNFSKYTKFVL